MRNKDPDYRLDTLYIYNHPAMNHSSFRTIEERIVPAYKGVDVQYLQRHYVATGFSADGFSYFVSSAYQPWEPEDVDHPRDDLKDEGGDPQLLYRVKVRDKRFSSSIYRIAAKSESMHELDKHYIRQK